MRKWKVKQNLDLFDQAWALLSTRSDRVVFEWVKGHSGHHGNDGADALANAALSRPSSRPDRAST
jgi:ribonuclease HI